MVTAGPSVPALEEGWGKGDSAKAPLLGNGMRPVRAMPIANFEFTRGHGPHSTARFLTQI
jgi:hypothetical protein